MVDVVMYCVKIDGCGIFKVYLFEMGKKICCYYYLFEEMCLVIVSESFYLFF